MGWRNWVRRRAAGTPRGAASAAVREGEDGDYLWRAISPRAGTPLSGTGQDPTDWSAMTREAYRAYCTNPLAYAVIEQQTNFVLGGGAHVVAVDPRVQRVVDGFWNDPDNAMDRRVYAIQTELALFGEQFIRYFVDPVTGRTVIRQLDPLDVAGIETDPEDVERVLGYWYRPGASSWRAGAGPWSGAGSASGAGASGGDDGRGDGEGEDRDKRRRRDWVPAEEVSHFAINKVSNALRGRSDLAPVLRWLHAYSDWLADRVTQNRLKGAVVYDVTLVGGGKQDIERHRAEQPQAPETGTVIFHSDKEIWKAVEPHVGAADVRDDGRALRLMVAAGSGIPEHYLGEGGNANRATAAEMGLPAIKRMQRRQEHLRQVLATICGRAVAEAVRMGKIGPRVRRDLTVRFEELGPSGVDQEASAAKGFAEALAMAEERGWVDSTQARQLWWRFAGEPEVGMKGGVS